LIEQAWRKAQQKLGSYLFDGPMCRLERVGTDGGRLNLLLSRTSYKVFYGTNLCHSEIAIRHGMTALANPMGISCALISDDGYLMFGKRSDRVAYYPGRVHPFAGALEPRERLDVFEDARRELNEELGLGRSDIREMLCLGLAEDRTLRQ